MAAPNTNRTDNEEDRAELVSKFLYNMADKIQKWVIKDWVVITERYSYIQTNKE